VIKKRSYAEIVADHAYGKHKHNEKPPKEEKKTPEKKKKKNKDKKKDKKASKANSLEDS
jgi:hypothetical protein